jgi:transcriptional regulator with XRE-family HTH domain
MTTNQARIQDFRSRLGMIREKKGLTQSQLSKYSGFDLHFIQEIESGTIEPELVVLLTLADTLEVEIRGLFDY